MGADGAGADSSETLFELSQSLAQFGVWTLDRDARSLTVSDELARILGRTADELQGSMDAALALVLPDHRDEMSAYNRAIVTGDPSVEPLQVRVVRPDGEVRWVEARAQLTGPDHVVGIVQDITTRMRAQEELEAFRARAEVAQEMGHFATIEMDLVEQTVTWSPEMYRITGRDPATFSPDADAFTVLHPDDVSTALENVEDIISGRGGRPVEFRVIRPDGAIRWIRSHGRPVAEGRLVGFVQDVTEHHELDEDRRLHTRILELMRETVTVIGHDPPRYLYVNPRFTEWLGITTEEALAISPDSLLSDRNVTAEVRDALLRHGGWEGDLTVPGPDGVSHVSHLSITPLNLPDRGRVNLIVSSDVTELRARERELRESEERHRLIQEHSPIGMGIMSLSLEWVDANAALCAILGRDLDDLRRLTLEEVTHADDVADDRVLVDRVLAGEFDSYQREKRYVRPDGTIVWVLVSVFLLRDGSGDAQCFVGQIIDVTDRKEAELKLQRSALQLQEANDAKTHFLSRMSHELRTPLNAVLGYGQLLAFADLAGEDRDSVDQILNAGRHLLALIDEVLDITSVEAGDLKLDLTVVDMAAAIGHAVQLVQPMAATNEVAIVAGRDGDETTGTGDPPGPSGVGDRPAPTHAWADHRRVAQILLNLLSNAIKYNRRGGTVTVSVTTHDDRVQVSVADTGLGIAAEALTRVFDPFDRLGADQLGIEGTGIGLSLARNLAERMGGTLEVRSVPGEGSTFTLELPGGKGAPSDDPARTGAVVDDPPVRVVHIEGNVTNQRLIDAAMKRRFNVELHTATSAVAGLALVSEVHPDLVLLGLGPSDLPSSDVLRRLTSMTDVERATVVVLGTETDLDQLNTFIAAGADGLLTQPLDLEALYAVLDRLPVQRR